MPLSGTSGVEDRGSSTYNAIFTFDMPVTSGTAAVTSGVGTAGAPTFSGNEISVPLSGVTDVQVITITVSNVNGSGGSNSVAFGFLEADVNASRVVDKPDITSVKANQGGVTGANFRNDINADGTINRLDAKLIKPRKGNSLP